MNLSPLLDLADRWEREAETLRARGLEREAAMEESFAEELRDALTSWEAGTVTLREAAELGGYSYSHLQHLVAEGEIENVGEKGSPRIRRSDVPVKPGQENGRAESKGDRLERSLQLHRGE